MRQHRWIRRGGPALTALCAVALVAPHAAALDKPEPYEVSDEAKKVKGTSSSADAPRIGTGLISDTIKPGEEKFYSVILDAKSSAHVTGTAVPTPGSKVSFKDGIEVSLQSTSGTDCGSEKVSATGETAYPMTALASRLVGPDSDEDCLAKGPYLVHVKRDPAPGSDPGAWPLELSYMKEPGLKGSIPAPRPGTDEETDENNKRPAPPTGKAKQARGGTGFNDARAVGNGVWKDRLRPGETRYYRVPVDWGQRLFAGVEVPNSPQKELSMFIGQGFRMNVFNTARASLYRESFKSYNGDGGKFDRYTNPVRYENRFAGDASQTRFGGWYYVAVTANSELAKAFPKGMPLTLRIAVKGEPKGAPEYDGDAAAAGIGVGDEDREVAEKGQTAAEASDSANMKTFGYAGIGAGAALIAVLAAWLLLARRRAARATAGAPGGPWPPQPPQGGFGGVPGQPTVQLGQPVQSGQPVQPVQSGQPGFSGQPQPPYAGGYPPGGQSVPPGPSAPSQGGGDRAPDRQGPGAAP
ncbi:hypothetical protein [Streptomyces iconiensis]|uniref:Uncharacterized protein n=1 Tax=Streptomyces iconiensis TaxID=1384038 RepID=A0ABT6ZRF4_9ACTN|nr:hypothetical protein [Streptomyces iconiensis]MDJ1131640.1 hypothetical protein [Streptomyces iconiensis]